MITIKNSRNSFFCFWHWIHNSKVIVLDKTNFGQCYKKQSIFLAMTHILIETAKSTKLTWINKVFAFPTIHIRSLASYLFLYEINFPKSIEAWGFLEVPS